MLDEVGIVSLVVRLGNRSEAGYAAYEASTSVEAMGPTDAAIGHSESLRPQLIHEHSTTSERQMARAILRGRLEKRRPMVRGSGGCNSIRLMRRVTRVANRPRDVTSQP
jgi:hypothetical protein